MARQDVIELLTEHHAGLIDDDRLMRFLDQIECSADELEEADMELQARRTAQALHNPNPSDN